MIGGAKVLKASSKIVAYKSLQGRPVSYDGIQSSFWPRGLSIRDRSNLDFIVQYVLDNPVLKVFNTLNPFYKIESTCPIILLDR